jgi:hypothetical protein
LFAGTDGSRTFNGARDDVSYRSVPFSFGNIKALPAVADEFDGLPRLVNLNSVAVVDAASACQFFQEGASIVRRSAAARHVGSGVAPSGVKGSKFAQGSCP